MIGPRPSGTPTGTGSWIEWRPVTTALVALALLALVLVVARWARAH